MTISAMRRFLVFVFIICLAGFGRLFAQSQVEDLNKKELLALLLQLDSSLNSEGSLLKNEKESLVRLRDSIAGERLLLKNLTERRRSLSDSLAEIRSRILVSKNDKSAVAALLEKERLLAGKATTIRNNVHFAVTSQKVDSVSYSDPSGTSYYRITVELVIEGTSNPVDSYLCIMKSAGECGQNDADGFDTDLLVFPESIREDLILDSVILGREISRQNTIYSRMAALYGLDEILLIEFELGRRSNSYDKAVRILKSIPL